MLSIKLQVDFDLPVEESIVLRFSYFLLPSSVYNMEILDCFSAICLCRLLSSILVTLMKIVVTFNEKFMQKLRTFQ